MAGVPIKRCGARFSLWLSVFSVVKAFPEARNQKPEAQCFEDFARKLLSPKIFPEISR